MVFMKPDKKKRHFLGTSLFPQAFAPASALCFVLSSGLRSDPRSLVVSAKYRYCFCFFMKIHKVSMSAARNIPESPETIQKC